MNLFRDQLDRYGELETLVDKWRDVLDDLAAQQRTSDARAKRRRPQHRCARPRTETMSCGSASTTPATPLATAPMRPTQRCVATAAPRSNTPLYLVGHLGHWDCPNCDCHSTFADSQRNPDRP